MILIKPRGTLTRADSAQWTAAKGGFFFNILKCLDVEMLQYKQDLSDELFYFYSLTDIIRKMGTLNEYMLYDNPETVLFTICKQDKSQIFLFYTSFLNVHIQRHFKVRSSCNIQLQLSLHILLMPKKILLHKVFMKISC